MSSAFLLSAQAVMLLAFLSALSRAGLNIVDRYQMGFRGLSIRQVNLWNNIIPALLMVILCISFGLGYELLGLVLNWKTIIFSALVQLVAYSFSFAFRHLNVNQVTVTAKLSDFFIPIGIFCTTTHWSWSNYSFAAITTLVCLPMLWKHDGQKKLNFLNREAFFIIGALVLQASLAPLLIMAPTGLASDIRHALLFTVTVLLWRSFWSFLPILFRRQAVTTPLSLLFLNPVFYVRIILTIITQVSFIFAIGRPKSLVAWPILNSTGIFALIFSRKFLNEEQTHLEQIIVIAITLLELGRFFSL